VAAMAALAAEERGDLDALDVRHGAERVVAALAAAGRISADARTMFAELAELRNRVVHTDIVPTPADVDLVQRCAEVTINAFSRLRSAA